MTTFKNLPNIMEYGSTPYVGMAPKQNGVSISLLNAASVYIRSKVTSAYRGERIYTLKKVRKRVWCS